MSTDFKRFYHQSKMFLYIGKGLNRSSYQIYVRLQTLYHPYVVGPSDAQTDSYIMKRVPELNELGHHQKYKIIEEEIGRFHRSVASRYGSLTSEKSGFDQETTLRVLEAIAEHQKREINEIDFDDDTIPLSCIAEKLGINEAKFISLWMKEGKKIVARSTLPSWTLKDSLALLNEIEREGEEDENCVDFEGIYRRAFVGRVENWQHLRERYNGLRRRVPLYLIKDLPSVLSAVKKDVRERIGKRGKDARDEEDEVEEDADGEQEAKQVSVCRIGEEKEMMEEEESEEEDD